MMIKGFSLIELMVTLMVLAIILAFGAPMLSGYTANQRIKDISVLLQSDLNYAREQAVLRRVSVSVTPATGGWNNGWTIRDTNISGISGVLKRRDGINNNVNLTASPNAGVTFNGQGWATTAFNIQVNNASTATNGCVGNRARGLSISTTGLLTVSPIACSATSTTGS